MEREKAFVLVWFCFGRAQISQISCKRPLGLLSELSKWIAVLAFCGAHAVPSFWFFLLLNSVMLCNAVLERIGHGADSVWLYIY